MECPVCQGYFTKLNIENHVNDCLNSSINCPENNPDTMSKRSFPFVENEETSLIKKSKIDGDVIGKSLSINNDQVILDKNVPLAEKLRPDKLEDFVGQKHVIGDSTVLGQLLGKNEITSFIIWGPPGCGKTTLVNVIAKQFKNNSKCPKKFIKLSATSSGIADIRKSVITAENSKKNGQQTIVFMDEIHRFNKLQQDIFLPHVEVGTFTLIGATTENPSYSLNSALLSRCRVFSLDKLNPDDIKIILHKAIKILNGKIDSQSFKKNRIPLNDDEKSCDFKIEEKALNWLINVADGDARVAIGSLEVAVKLKNPARESIIQLNDLKISMEKACELSMKKYDMNVHIVAALHRCIKDGHENGALYWLARLMDAKEDPVFIAKRLIRIASEEISTDDPDAHNLAVHTMHGCQIIGMPECDVILGQCVAYLCRAPKSKTINLALRKVQNIIMEHKGPQPSVPQFIKDRSSQRKLQALGKNFIQAEDDNRDCLPPGLVCRNFYDDSF